MKLAHRGIFAASLLLAATLALLPGSARAAGAAADGRLTLALDARDVPIKLLHAKLVIPASPGPLTLYYPKWLPGEHTPSGPVVNLAGPRLTANGKPLAWERDPDDMYSFHVVVPAGAAAVEATYDLLGSTAGEGFSSSASATERLAMLNWNEVVLYPAGRAPEDIRVAASVRLPAGWRWASALRGHESAGAVEFEPVSLVTLIDSPVMTGAYMRSIPLTTDARPVTLDMAADSPEALDVPAERVAALKRLVAEARALFGAEHYDAYHFLLLLSDHTAHFGLEHHQCSDDQVGEQSMRDPMGLLGSAGLLPHEYVHSWNGKYRRPAGLATPDYQKPMRGELLWVYEGLTQYLGNVLAARSGLFTPKQYRNVLALAAAGLENHRGREWRPLHDTAVAAQILYGSPGEWGSERRGTDFYDEGQLIWLEADAVIRRETHGQRSMDDFCRRFHGAPSGSPRVVPYTLDDVVATLESVAPYDWRHFLAARIDAVTPHAPLGGIEADGWRLAYGDSASDIQRAREKSRHSLDLTCSIGLQLSEEGGSVRDVVPESPAARAGAGPGMKLLAVNGRRFSERVLHDAVRATASGKPLELLFDDGEFYRTCRLDYRGGERYPQLDRKPGGADGLADVIRPLAH